MALKKPSFIVALHPEIIQLTDFKPHSSGFARRELERFFCHHNFDF
jgi:hypothetical protein